MSDYNYIMGSLLIPVLFLFIMGTLGAAEDIYGDEFYVYDSTQNDTVPDSVNSSFDISRLRFNPVSFQPEDKIDVEELDRDSIIRRSSIEERDPFVYNWDGSPNDGNVLLNDSNLPANNEYGYIAWNVTERNDTFYFKAEDDVNVDIRYRDVSGFEQEISTATTPDSYKVNLDGSGFYDGSGNEVENIEVLQLAFSSTDASADVGGGTYTKETSTFNLFGPFEVLARYIVNFYDAGAELLSIFVSYIDFTTKIPGMIGTLLRFYMGIFIPVLLLREFWF